VVCLVGKYGVVQELDTQQFPGLLEAFCDILVVVARAEDVAGVVVCDDYRGGAFLQGFCKDLNPRVISYIITYTWVCRPGRFYHAIIGCEKVFDSMAEFSDANQTSRWLVGLTWALGRVGFSPTGIDYLP
jgi:hypothetical protein